LNVIRNLCFPIFTGHEAVCAFLVLADAFAGDCGNVSPIGFKPSRHLPVFLSNTITM
jgi:hypothetical protein